MFLDLLFQFKALLLLPQQLSFQLAEDETVAEVDLDVARSGNDPGICPTKVCPRPMKRPLFRAEFRLAKSPTRVTVTDVASSL